MDGQPGGSGGGGAGSDCDAVARAFVEYYYRTFDANRGALAALYAGPHTSALSFEGHAVAGAEEIGRKLAQLPFGQCRHSVSTVDCQPSPSFPGGILVFVSGHLQLAGEDHQLRFSQVRHLLLAQVQLVFYISARGIHCQHSTVSSYPGELSLNFELDRRCWKF